jgi:hypothetical protein
LVFGMPECPRISIRPRTRMRHIQQSVESRVASCLSRSHFRSASGLPRPDATVCGTPPSADPSESSHNFLPRLFAALALFWAHTENGLADEAGRTALTGRVQFQS